MDHAFFTRGIVPGYIPTSAHDAPPDFRHISRVVSEANLARLRKYALLDEDQQTSIAVPSAPAPTIGSKLKAVSSSLAQQEKEFQKAVQPGSPISALLSSARQPLLVAPASARGEVPLIRKLQAAKDAKSPARMTRDGRAPGGSALRGIDEELDDHDRIQQVRRKELESQKARIVAQMVPSAPTPVFEEDVENIPPVSRRAEGSVKTRGKERE